MLSLAGTSCSGGESREAQHPWQGSRGVPLIEPPLPLNLPPTRRGKIKNNGEGTPLTHPGSVATPLDIPFHRSSAHCPPRLSRYVEQPIDGPQHSHLGHRTRPASYPEEAEPNGGPLPVFQRVRKCAGPLSVSGRCGSGGCPARAIGQAVPEDERSEKRREPVVPSNPPSADKGSSRFVQDPVPVTYHGRRNLIMLARVSLENLPRNDEHETPRCRGRPHHVAW